MRLSSILSLLLTLCLGTSLFSQNIHPDYQDGKLYFKIRNESEVVFRSLEGMAMDKNARDIHRIFQKYDVSKLERPFVQLKTEVFDRTYQVEFQNPSRINDLIKELSQLEYIEYAERVELLRTTLVPNDPGVPQMYHLTNISAFDAWDIHTGGNAIVAIVDDAVRITHSDLAPNLWVNTGEIAGNGIDDDGNGYIDDVNGFDVADNDGNPNPPASAADFTFSHGTHCAGIACGATNNSNGIASIGFNNKIMAVKSTSDGGNPQFIQNGFLGVSYAIAAGADVISMSWGGTGSTITSQNIINQAHNLGITLVAAAGNDHVSTVFYPAGYNFVISVAATDPNDQKWTVNTPQGTSGSNYGSWIDISAPGSGIISTVATSNTSYQTYSGTSMACPMVAGLCGLLKSFDGSLTPDDIEQCLDSSADNIDAQNPSYLNQLGSGRINANLALQCTNPSNPPVADFSVSPQGEQCSGSTIQFNDFSLFTPTAWSWSFPGGTPNVSNQQNPVVTYNNPGIYDVTLTITNQFGTDSKTEMGIIIISNNGIEEFFLEDFENSGNGWQTDNPDGATTWTLATISGNEGGTNAAAINNFSYNAPGQRDALISPTLDFSGRSNVSMDFEYAHRRKSQNQADSLVVSVSSDGGNSWSVLYANAEDGTGVFATNFVSNQSFVPQSVDDWCFSNVTAATCPSLDLSAYDGMSNILIRFVNVNDNGNNIFVDNISLKSSCFVPAGAPTTEFTSDITGGCEGTVVQFTDLSYGNPDPTSWSWSFPGGTPSSSNQQNPSITYNSSGTYNVSLTTNNTGGSDTETMTNYITIDQNTSHTFYSEDFESATNDWTVNNPDGDKGFELIGVGGTTSGSMAYYINHYDYATTGQLDELISPVIDFTGKQNVSLEIDYAYAIYDAQYNDQLNIYVSNDGGNSYNLVFNASDTGAGTYATTPALTTNFSPTQASDWCFAGTFGAGCINLDLSAYDNMNNMVIKFETVNGYGNNLFIDNITLTNTCNAQQAAPSANFTANTTNGCAPLAVNLIDQSSGNPNSWSWVVNGPANFSSAAQNPSFNLTQAGTYSVSLVASNAAGNDTEVQNAYISVSPASDINYTYNTNNNTTSFTNTSTTTGNVIYNWNFGDGNNSNLENPTHTYSADGNYTVTLTITDDCGTNISAQNISINSPEVPTASFSSNVIEGCSPLVVSFTDNSAGGPDTWSWTISGPENQNSTDQNPNFTLNSVGTYNVTLVASNANGTNTIVENNYITVYPASSVDFSFIDLTDGNVNFTSLSSTTGNVSYNWTFGDGGTSNIEDPSHLYAASGTYLVTLTISDDCGTTSFSSNVNVSIMVNTNDIEGVDAWNISPNPSNGQFNLSIEGQISADLQVDVVDLLGRTLESYQVSSNQQAMDLSGYAKGTYFIVLKDQKGSDVRKVVIQ